jgi:Tol biopolymer transport system component
MRRAANLWIIDAATGSPTQLTSDDDAAAPSWFPNGRRLAYSARVADRWDFWALPVGGSARPSPIVRLPQSVFSAAVVPGGRAAVVVFGRLDHSTLARVRLDGNQEVDTLAATARDGEIPFAVRVSPDGHWVAYLDARGGYGVASSRAWVRSIDGAAALQVSANATGGNPVVWGPDSRRLYYASPEGLVEIDLRITPTLAVVGRHVIHRFPSLASRFYDLSPDGKTFVVAKPVTSAADVIVVLNWADEARRAWSAGGIP